MYESFYGLKEKPFAILPDPDYIYFSQNHQNAYDMLEYAITDNTGFAVLTGEIGSGKTTLLNHLIKQMGSAHKIGLINSTHVNYNQLVKMICLEFELDVRGMDLVEMVDHLYQFLLSQYAQRVKVVLIIDEAQNLSEKVLDQIRMLSNFDAEKECLIHLILLGQPELKRKLGQKQLEQFAQRITMSYHLNRLDVAEVHSYIQHRLKIGGAQRLDIISNDAVKAIAEYSKGIPRLINTLCEISLLYGFAEELLVIGKDVIEEIIAEKGGNGAYAFGTASEVEITGDGISNAAKFLEHKIKSLDNKIDEIKDALVTNKSDLVTLQPRIVRSKERAISAIKVMEEPGGLPKPETPKKVRDDLDQPEPVNQVKTLKFTKIFEKIGMDL